MTLLRFCLLLKARVSPLEKGGESSSGAIRPPSCHYCALIEPLCVGRGHYDHFSLLIALPFMPLNSLQGQFWTPLSAASWDTNSSHRQMLAPTNQGTGLWFHGSATQSTGRAEGWGQRLGLFERVIGEAGGRVMSPEVKLNYVGVDLNTLQQVGVCRGKVVHLAS